jgi:hypothetical protein
VSAGADANDQLHGDGRIEGEFVGNKSIPIASKLSKKLKCVDTSASICKQNANLLAAVAKRWGKIGDRNRRDENTTLKVGHIPTTTARYGAELNN